MLISEAARGRGRQRKFDKKRRRRERYGRFVGDIPALSEYDTKDTPEEERDNNYEPCAQTRESQKRFWRTEKQEEPSGIRLSYPFVVPVTAVTDVVSRRVRAWVLCRIATELILEEDPVLGSGWSCAASLILLDRVTVKSIGILYRIESRQIWSRWREASRRAGVDGEAMYRQIQAQGVPLQMIKQYTEDWVVQGMELEEPLIEATRETEGYDNP